MLPLFIPSSISLPSKENGRLGVIKRTQTTPARSNPHRQRLLARKIRRQYTDARHEQTPGPKTGTKCLREHDLPVLAGDGSHHHAEDYEE